MKVLVINGSPHKNASTKRAINEVVMELNKAGIETKIMDVGGLDIRGCTACGYCYKNKMCVFNDIVNEAAVEFEAADGLLVASPVYYSSANGTLISFLDRLFYSSSFDKTMKVGASIVSARRGGTTATFDQLNKYFMITSMPVASSQYWNQVHGNNASEVEKDEEGLQVMRTLGKNMAFLIKSIALGKEKLGLPEKEKRIGTNFIR